MVVAIVSTILGLLTAILLNGISGAKSTKPGDITFVAVLMSIFLGVGLLLFGLRYLTLKKRLSVRVFADGVVRSSGGSHEVIRFSQAERVDFAHRETTFSMTVRAKDGRTIDIEPNRLENVDNTLAAFVRNRIDDPAASVPPIAPQPSAGEVLFRAGTEANPPLLGKGKIEVSSDGVRMMGARARTALPIVLGCVVGVFGVIAFAVVLTAMDFKMEGRGSTKLLGVLGFASGVGPGWLVYSWLRKRMSSSRIDVVVPWSSLLLFKHRAGGVGATVTTEELRGNMEIVAQDEAAAAALAQMTRVGPHGEYGFAS